MTDIQEVVDVGQDGLLELLVRGVQHAPSAKLSVTLVMRGVVVTGILVGRDIWADEVTKLISSAGPMGKDLGETIQQTFMEADLESPADGQTVYRFIHLVQAQYVDGSGPVNKPGVPWRGRLSEVSGWNFGMIAR